MTYKNIILAIAAILIMFQVIGTETTEAPVETMPYSTFLRALDSDTISTVEITGDQISGLDRNGKNYTTIRPWDPGLMERIANTKAEVRVISNSNPTSAISIILGFLPLIIFMVIAIMILKMMGGAMSRQMNMGKSKAVLVKKEKSTTTFKDIAGIDEARAELEEIVDFLKNPERYWSLGGKIPKGVLLSGGPGLGKTLLAKAVAGEAGVPFYATSGSDFVEMFVGVGASRVRSMFQEARKNAPCILFIDEIDAIGRRRSGGYGAGNEEREQTLNQMLVEMDGFGDRSGVIVIGATNRNDVLDPALLRPGRFDRHISVTPPDLEGRIKILAVHARNVAMAIGADLERVARGCPGFSGADLANLVNEAALCAARRGGKNVDTPDFEAAKDRILMGSERRSSIPNQEDLSLTAYHEAGHAVVSILTPGCDPIHKATVIPRGQSLGMVVSLPERDKPTQKMSSLKAKIAMTMGGRAAEEIIFGAEHVTNGAASDIEQATRMARAMVSRFGMSEKMGPVAYEMNHGAPTPGSQTEIMIMEEVRSIVENGMKTALNTLKENRDALERVAQALLDHETIDGETVKAIVENPDFVFMKKTSDVTKSYDFNKKSEKSGIPRIQIGGVHTGSF